MEAERCSMCDDYTGHAGAGEDSLFCECGEGPLCCDCGDEHRNECDADGDLEPED